VAYYNNLRVVTCYLYTELEYPRRTYAVVFLVGTPISPGWRRLLFAMRGRHGCQPTVEAGRPAGCCSGISVPCRFLIIFIRINLTALEPCRIRIIHGQGNLLFDSCHATAGSCCSTVSKPLLLAAFMEFYTFFHPMTPRRHIQSVLLSTTLFKFLTFQKTDRNRVFENHRFEYCFQVFF